MKEFLSQRGVAYREVDVASDTAARDEVFKKTGRMAVPVVSMGGQVVVGFNRNELEKMLQ